MGDGRQDQLSVTEGVDSRVAVMARRYVPILVLLLAVPLGISTIMIKAYSGTSDISQDVAVGPPGDSEVVVVAYRFDGVGGMAGLPVWLHHGATLRLAAVDVGTGDLRWDTRLQARYPLDEASVLAVGRHRAYVATDSGLKIIDMEEGEVLVEDAEISGLGDAFHPLTYGICL